MTDAEAIARVLDEFRRNGLPHLQSQFSQARPILFTGAGFSRSVRNLAGNPIPTGRELGEQIWALSFPGDPFEEGSVLQDLYQDALARNPRQLNGILQRALTVDARTIPDWYRSLLALPWYKIYTLNVDDLGQAASRRFDLPRAIRPVSATALTTGVGDQLTAHLPEIHLNGTIDDAPANVTFSVTQYAERLAHPDPWYTRLASELLLHPVVFVGTRLDESPLWQHVEMRRHRGPRHGTREFRPRSYLVTPSLNRARLALLDEYNVMWVPYTAEEFARNVVPELERAAARGHELIGRLADFGTRHMLEIVSEIAGAPHARSEFLLGAEPTWTDLIEGRVATRDFEEDLSRDALARLRSFGPAGVLILTGTAGAGKSASAMRLALTLSAEGFRVGWMDRDSSLAPGELRRAMAADDAPAALVIDDAESYGSELGPMTGDIATERHGPLVVVVVRSSRLAQLLPAARMPDVIRTEHAMPVLTDGDIDRLLEILARENRLGVLRGKSRDEQRNAFRSRADRQLLVAMLEATSGQKFEDKITSEYGELDADSQVIYAIVAVASHFGFSLSRQDVLSVLGERSNAAVAALDMMLRAGVLLPASHGVDLIRARHRVIADVLLVDLQHRGVLGDAIHVAAVIAASHVTLGMRRNERPWRFLRQLINHEFLLRTVGAEVARGIYGDLESLLDWDHHYWLQRGSMELESDRLDIAQNFLAQARGLAPDDPFVLNEWAYLMYKLALRDPSLPTAQPQADEARAILHALIADRGRRDHYMFHVYGSQGLAWARRAYQSHDEKVDLLDDLVEVVSRGVELHPEAPKLQSLLQELKRARLTLATQAHPSDGAADASRGLTNQT